MSMYVNENVKVKAQYFNEVWLTDTNTGETIELSDSDFADIVRYWFQNTDFTFDDVRDNLQYDMSNSEIVEGFNGPGTTRYQIQAED